MQIPLQLSWLEITEGRKEERKKWRIAQEQLFWDRKLHLPSNQRQLDKSVPVWEAPTSDTWILTVPLTPDPWGENLSLPSTTVFPFFLEGSLCSDHVPSQSWKRTAHPPATVCPPRGRQVVPPLELFSSAPCHSQVQKPSQYCLAHKNLVFADSSLHPGLCHLVIVYSALQTAGGTTAV